VRVREIDYSPGERVVLAVREELTKIVKRIGEEQEINFFPGTIQSSSFLGNSTLFEILLKNGDVVNSKIPVSKQRKTFSSNERVYIRFHPENIKTYPYPQAGLFRELEAI
jgi:ABC-type Fe3+/spermidine/putrescine transport system ATPase subunit